MSSRIIGEIARFLAEDPDGRAITADLPPAEVVRLVRRRFHGATVDSIMAACQLNIDMAAHDLDVLQEKRTRLAAGEYDHPLIADDWKAAGRVQ